MRLPPQHQSVLSFVANLVSSLHSLTSFLVVLQKMQDLLTRSIDGLCREYEINLTIVCPRVEDYLSGDIPEQLPQRTCIGLRHVSGSLFRNGFGEKLKQLYREPRASVTTAGLMQHAERLWGVHSVDNEDKFQGFVSVIEMAMKMLKIEQQISQLVLPSGNNCFCLYSDVYSLQKV